MAEEQEQPQPRLSTQFPAPPPFWKQFTSDNLNKLDMLKKEKNVRLSPSRWTASELRTLELPPELRLLIPPEPPSSGTYSCFGQELHITDTLPALTSKGIPQLYPTASPTSQTPTDHAYSLLKIAKSILLNFVEYVGILSSSPSHHEGKIQDIQSLFINAHHLINMYRPHQARETLILRMEREIEEGRREMREMRVVMGKVDGLLRELEEEGREIDVGVKEVMVKGSPEQGKRIGKRLWETMDLDSDRD